MVKFYHYFYLYLIWDTGKKAIVRLDSKVHQKVSYQEVTNNSWKTTEKTTRVLKRENGAFLKFPRALLNYFVLCWGGGWNAVPLAGIDLGCKTPKTKPVPGLALHKQETAIQRKTRLAFKPDKMPQAHPGQFLPRPGIRHFYFSKAFQFLLLGKLTFKFSVCPFDDLRELPEEEAQI